MKVLPEWVLSMPKLSWLAFSGNLFNITPSVAVLPSISWHELSIYHVLGEGASGIIFKGEWHGDAEKAEVAVKVFKGAVTSDGLPEDEMNTFIAAGQHHGLVSLIGRVSGHPEGKEGLVMELIPERFYNLGMPPSLESCTRDVFADGAGITIGQALKIAATIASVACQLHDRCIMHGDLYAHNTLTDDEGNTLFGDFGAATFYDKTDADAAFALERLEVSAFGHLLDDLLFLCNEKGNDATKIKLGKLRDECRAPVVSSRPGFRQINGDLMNLRELYFPGNSQVVL